MTCRKTQGRITPFINDELNLQEMEEFLEHVSSCHECRDELEVYYALLTAMRQLEEDKILSDNYELELTDKLERAHEKVIHAKFTYYRKKFLLYFTIIILAVFISLSYADRSRNREENLKQSDFLIRREFHGMDNQSMDLLLQKYLSEQNIKGNGWQQEGR